jgi:hypothetical protein
VRAAPAVSCANCANKAAHEHTGQRRHSDIPCAMALRLISCSPQSGRARCHCCSSEALAPLELDASKRGVRTTRLHRTPPLRSSIATSIQFARLLSELICTQLSSMLLEVPNQEFCPARDPGSRTTFFQVWHRPQGFRSGKRGYQTALYSPPVLLPNLKKHKTFRWASHTASLAGLFEKTQADANHDRVRQ